MTNYDPYANRFYDGGGHATPSYDPYSNKIIDEQRVGEAGDYDRMNGTNPARSMVASRYDEINARIDKVVASLNDYAETMNKVDSFLLNKSDTLERAHNGLDDRVNHFEQLNKMLIHCMMVCTAILVILGVTLSVAFAVVYDDVARLRDELHDHIDATASVVVEVQDDASTR